MFKRVLVSLQRKSLVRNIAVRLAEKHLPVQVI